MSADLRRLTADLRAAVERLKQRCLDDEARIADLQTLLAEQTERMNALQSENATLATRYRNLRSGMAATGNDPEAIRQLRLQYLGLINEIDTCIAQLER